MVSYDSKTISTYFQPKDGAQNGRETHHTKRL